MRIVDAIWKTLRGMSVLIVLAVLFTGALVVSCLLRLFLANGFSGVAGKLHLSS